MSVAGVGVRSVWIVLVRLAVGLSTVETAGISKLRASATRVRTFLEKAPALKRDFFLGGLLRQYLVESSSVATCSAVDLLVGSESAVLSAIMTNDATRIMMRIWMTHISLN